METRITIMDFEDKRSKAGNRYTRFQTDKGWMTAFEPVSAELKKYEHKDVDVDMSDDGKGSPIIRKIIGDAVADKKEIKPSEFGTPKTENKVEKPFTKDPVGMAVDLVISGKSVKDAIDAVKEIQKAFD